MPLRVFISSVQSEFAEERRNLRDFIRSDATLSRYFDVFLFEDQPAQTRSPTDLYLDEVERCNVYVGLFGVRYGYEDAEGVSPTEREYDRAVQHRKHRLVFVRETDEERHPKEDKLIGRTEAAVVRRRFVGFPDLAVSLRVSLMKVLEDERILITKPFDASPAQLTLKFIDDQKVEDFRALADSKRGFRLVRAKNTKDALTQLNLFDDNRPNNAAILLFSSNPERVASGAEIKCAHYAGAVPARPALSFKIFNGSLFEQIDLAVGFVMDRLGTSLSARTEGAGAPIAHEIPRDAVNETIVNAIAHRDYTSAAGVHVNVFSDRVEIANPGELPRGLTPEHLREIHSSIPRNPLLAKAFFLSGYMDTGGTGTLEMIRVCREAGLPEPSFAQRGDQWTVTLWRDWLTEAYLNALWLNERQRKAMSAIKMRGRLDNSSYQELTGASEATALRDLRELAKHGVVVRVGGGRTASYERAREKPVINPSIPSPAAAAETRHKPVKAVTPAKKTAKRPAKKAKKSSD